MMEHDWQRAYAFTFNGVAVPMTIHLDRLNQTFALPTEPLRIGGGERNLRAKLDDVRIYNRDLTDIRSGTASRKK